MGHVHIQVSQPPSQHAPAFVTAELHQPSPVIIMQLYGQQLPHAREQSSSPGRMRHHSCPPNSAVGDQTSSCKCRADPAKCVQRSLAAASCYKGVLAQAPPQPGQSRAQCPAPPLPTHMRVSGPSLCMQVTGKGSSQAHGNRCVTITGRICTSLVHGNALAGSGIRMGVPAQA